MRSWIFLNHQLEQKEQWAIITLLLNTGVLVLGTLLLTLLSPFLSLLWHMTHLTSLFCMFLCLSTLFGLLRTFEGLGIANSDFRPMLISSIIFGLLYWILLKFAPIAIQLSHFEAFLHSIFGSDTNGILNPSILVFLQFPHPFQIIYSYKTDQSFRFSPQCLRSGNNAKISSDTLKLKCNIIGRIL